VAVEDAVDLAFIGYLIFENNVLVLHVIEVPEAHPAEDH
jgi:hypothetical protein